MSATGIIAPSIMSNFNAGVDYDVSSANRDTGTDTNFTYTINIPKNRGRDFNRVCCTDAAIPRSWYLINNGENTFTLRELGNDTTITLPEGNYTIDEWCVAITSLLTAASVALGNNWVYTAEPDPTANTGKVLYMVTGNSGQPSFILGEHLVHQLGFPEGTTNTFSNNRILSTYIFSAAGEYAVKLRSDVCIPDGGSDTLADLYAISAYEPGSVAVYNAQNPILNSRRWDREYTGGTNAFTFQMCSAITGKHLDTHGEPVSFKLKFFHAPEDSMCEQLMLQNQYLKAQLHATQQLLEAVKNSTTRDPDPSQDNTWEHVQGDASDPVDEVERDVREGEAEPVEQEQTNENKDATDVRKGENENNVSA